MPLPYSGCGANSRRDIGLGPFYSRRQLQTLCDARRNGGRGCTSSAMGMDSLDTIGFEQMETISIQQNISQPVARHMSAFDQDCSRTHVQQLFSGSFHIV